MHLRNFFHVTPDYKSPFYCLVWKILIISIWLNRMPAVSASAPAKIILLGDMRMCTISRQLQFRYPEVRARAAILAKPPGKSSLVENHLKTRKPAHKSFGTFSRPCFSRHNSGFWKTAGISPFTSDADNNFIYNSRLLSGMVSGAGSLRRCIACACAVLGIQLNNHQISDMAFEAEKAYHGTPSENDIVSLQT